MPQKKSNSKPTKVSAERNGDKPLNAYFLSLELENVRCFGKKQKIDFSGGKAKPRQWTIILGDNGTGKTTLLQILVAIAPIKKRQTDGKETISQKYEKFLKDVNHHCSAKKRNVSVESINEFLTGNNVTEERKIFEYLIKNGYGVALTINLLDSVFQKQDGIIFEIYYGFALMKDGGAISVYGNDEANKLVNSINVPAYFAYGASRKVGETSLSEQNDENSYVTLFDETALLINPEEWLLQSDYASKRTPLFSERNHQLEKVIEILIKILPDVNNIRFTEKEQENKRIPKPIVEFHTPYGWVESKDLSLGYRTSMAWMVDFASRMFDLYPKSENPLAEPAVVLIDEIDLHLHPKWQRELIDYLTNLFPNTQFIVTTHSPLIVQAAAARDANIVVCRREGDHVVIDQSVEAVRGWRADQILTSDLFELPSTRDTELEKLEKQRREILSKAKLTKADEKKLKTLSAELESLRVMENPEDDKAMDIIRRAAAHLQNGKT